MDLPDPLTEPGASGLFESAIRGEISPATFLPVDVAPVSCFQHENQEVLILDRENDPVIAHPEPVSRRPCEPCRFTDMLVRILPEPGYRADDPAGHLGREIFEIPPGPGGVGDRTGHSSTPNSFRISSSE